MILLGINVVQMGASLQNAFSGNDQSKFKQGGNEYDMLIGLDRSDRSGINDVCNLHLRIASVKPLPRSKRSFFERVSEQPPAQIKW